MKAENEITIEIPRMDNLNEVNKLAKQVHELHVNWSPDVFLSVEEVIQKDYFENLIQNKEIYIAKLKDEIIGYVMFSIRKIEIPIMKYRKELNIEAVCVDENYRGNGIGTLLLAHIKEVGKARGCTNMHLTVNQENKCAIKLYEKFGFKVKDIAYMMKI